MECIHCGKHFKTQKGLNTHKCTFCQTCKIRVKFKNVKELSSHKYSDLYNCNESHDELPPTSHTDSKTIYNQGDSDLNWDLCGRHFKT